MKYKDFSKLKGDIDVYVLGDMDLTPVRVHASSIIRQKNRKLIYATGHPLGMSYFNYRDVYSTWDDACECQKRKFDDQIANAKQELAKAKLSLETWNAIHAMGPNHS